MLLTLVVATLVISGCAQKQTPYKVVKRVDYNHKTRGLQAYTEGVTQEKISATEYIITAKLSSSSDKIRSQNMVIYHAAILAQQSGYDSFDVLKRKSGQWCNFIKNRQGMKSYNDGGFKSSVRVVFTEIEAPKNKLKKVKRINVLEAINRLEPKINAVWSDEEIDALENQRWDSCFNTYR